MQHLSFLRRLFSTALLAGLATGALAQTQNVGIGTTAPNPKAALEIAASDKGLLIPRLDSVQRTGISAPPQGLIVYQTNGRAGLWYYQGGAWQYLQPGVANVTAANGLTRTGNQVGLGGTLSQNTTVGIGTNSLTVNGAGAVNLGTGTGATTLGNTTGATSVSGSSIGLTGPTNINTTGTGTTNVGTGTNAGAVTIGRSGGTVTMSNLAGTGTRMVIADPSGNLNTQAVPASESTTANNGLTLTGTNVQLGGRLSQPTTISTGTNSLSISGVTYASQVTLDQEQNTGNSTSSQSLVGQTFTAGVSGVLSRVDVFVGGTNISAYLTIYAGEGQGGQVLAFQSFNINSSTATATSINLTSQVLLVAGGKYTFVLEPFPTPFITYAFDSNNSYAGGQMLFNPSSDLRFRTYMLAEQQNATLTARNTGQVQLGSLAGTGTRLVTADASGNLSSATAASLDATTASNGLTVTGTSVGLGGTLTQATSVALNNQTFGLTRTGQTSNLGTPQTDQSTLATSWNGTTYTASMWQSFTAGMSGQLTAVTLTVLTGTGMASGFSLRIYAGTGTSGTLLASQGGLVNGFLAQTYSLNTGVELTAGQVYTIETYDQFADVGWRSSTTNPYAGGRNSVSTSGDFSFSTTVRPYLLGQLPLLTASNTSIGIGTSNPTATLDVDGTTRLRGLTTAGVVTTDASGNLSSAPATSLGDNLGNHTATQNLNLGASQLVGNGGTSGVSISNGGNVGIGTTSPAASAQLEIASTTKGFLPPRMSQTQRDAIASPATGLTIYNTTTNALNYWDGTQWTSALSFTEQPAQLPAVTFNYTGAVQTYTVPAGVTRLSVVARGASGGSDISGGVGNLGGNGAQVNATLTVVPGQVLRVYVGGAGGFTISGGGGGYNGGGNGAMYGSGGGGATDLRLSGGTLVDRLLVASGGGGGGYAGAGSQGGNGGAPNGGNGNAGPWAGTGATQTAGGSAGGALGTGSGALGTGGSAGGTFAGGGGGGYYGGGAAAGATGASGGGGSSWVTPTGSANITMTAGANTGNGSLTITPGLAYPMPVLDGSNFVNVPGDNLGNHTATQNLNLGTNRLVGNGGSTGISISNAGAVTLGNLTGTGTRLVTADPSGNLSTQALSVSTPLTGNGVGTALGIQIASAAQAGALSAADWTTFNTKLSTVTTAGAPLTGAGTSAAPLSINTASGSQSGALSAADWTTFNNKLTLPALTSGSVLFSNGTTLAQNNANLFWDNTNARLGLGTTSPGQRLHVVGVGRFENGGATLQLAGTGSGSHAFMEFYSDGIAAGRRAYFGFPNNGSTELSLMNTLPSGTVTLGTNATTRVTVSSAGSVGIGTPTPSSSLQVAGTIATTPVTGIAGGTAAAPTLLNSSNSSYLGLSPASGTNNNYRLPDPATCAGRMYVIRNNSGSFTAILTTAAGQLFNGSGNTGFASYTLNTNSAGKTLILFNDGVNWTIGQLN